MIGRRWTKRRIVRSGGDSGPGDSDDSTRRSELVGADDVAALAGEDVEPDLVRDRVLDELDAAVAEADIDPSGVQAADLAAGVVHPVPAVDAHAHRRVVGEERGELRGRLELVAAVV